MRALLWTAAVVLTVASGCDQAEMNGEVSPGGMTQPETEQATPGGVTPLQIMQGTQADLGDCRVGIMSVGVEDAMVAVSRSAGGWQQRVRKGQLLIGCGALYRVLDVGQFTASTNRPGGSGTGVRLDKTPVAVAGVSLAAQSVVLPVGGKLRFQSIDLTGLALAAGETLARFEFTVSTQGPSGIPQAGPVERGQASAGDTVMLGAGRWKILSVVPADAASGLPGWMEIDPTPIP